MKPSFALNLTEDGITLLHRTSRGWMDVGNVAFDDPDMGAALEYMRSTALGLSPKGIATKLIIPDSQILYLTVQAEGPDEASRRTQIEAALDGRTPYALDELAYDWTAEGSTVRVAVVARETLAEAEGFATEHRFNPVSFVARPEDGFGKEPFFGITGLAPTVVPTGDMVEPDDTPVTIIARDKARPDAAQAVTEEAAPPTPEPTPELTPVEEIVAEEEVAPRLDLALDVPAPDVTEPPAPDLPEPPPAEPEPPAPDLPEPDLPAPPPVTEPEPPAPAAPPEPPPEAPVMQPVAAPVPEGARVVAPEVPPAPAPVQPVVEAPKRFDPPRQAAAPIADETEAPMALDVPQDDLAEDLPRPLRGAASVTANLPPADDELPPTPSAAALMAFSSRRPIEGAPRPLGGVGSDLAETAKPVRTGAAPAAVRATAAKPVVERPAGARPAPKFSYDDPAPPPPRMPGDPPTASASVVGKASKGLRSLGNLVTSPTIPGTKKKKPVPNGAAPAFGSTPQATGGTLAAPLDSSPVKASVAAASQSLARQKSVSPDAIAKGLSARNMPQRGKPKYLGLILTGILLLLLALVAAWSSFYLTRSDDPAAEAQVAGFDGGVDNEAIADGQLPEAGEALAVAGPDLDDLPVDVDLTEVAPAEAELAAPAPAAAEPAPETGALDVAATANQPNPTNQDEIFLASMDAPPALSDPLVLPSPAAQGDAPPGDQMPPPPFGTVYQFDANGRIVPTAEGIMTPDGVLLIAGKPARVPPPRPAALEAAAAPQPAPDAAAAVVDAAAPAPAPTDLLPAQTFAADPSLAAARPRLRPPELVPETTADDDASLAPAEDSRFASLRPRLRPATVLAAGEAARQASEAASLAVQVAVAEAAVASAADANISPQAVAVSRVPAPRPRDLSRAVEAAVAAATRRPEPEVVAAAASAPRSAAPADEADDEPEVASAAPRIPTKANVAKQATFVNAINLGKLNLIGVYGTQSKRYALVRQPNGRYRKVRVGDNIDGGRVQAITASEVRYQKGGRMLALAMPNG